MNRKEREQVYIEKMTQLQRRWGNPIENDWNHIKEWSDKELEDEITGVVGQIQFEKGLNIAKWVFMLGFAAAVGFVWNSLAS